MAENPGKSVVVKVSGAALSAATEGLTHSANITWQITTASKRVLDRATTPTLEKSDGLGGWEDITYSSVNKLSGTFTFAAPGYADTETIRVKAGNYLPMSTAAYGHEYTFGKGCDILAAPKFGDTHKAKLAGQKFAYGTISQWDITSAYFSDALIAGNPVVIEFSPDGSLIGRVWALLESQEMQAAIESPQDEIVTFISTDAWLDIS